MIWTKLTRTDAVFSRAACMVYLCAGKRIFKHLRKIHEKSRKIHAPEETKCQKWGQRGARGCPGALWARPPRPRRGGAWVGPTPPGALLRLVFLLPTQKPQIRSSFAVFRRGAAATLCSSSGGLIWRLNWPPERGDRRHRHHHHHSIIPP